MLKFRRSDEIDNSLWVSGPVADVKRFIEASKGLPWQIGYDNQNPERLKNIPVKFCFNSLVPMPEDIYKHVLDPDENDNYMSKGKAWMLENWGTYPDIYEGTVTTDLDETNETARFFATFDTIYCVDTWVIAVAKQYPMLDFYLECIAMNEQYTVLRLLCKGEKYEFLPVDDDEDY